MLKESFKTYPEIVIYDTEFTTWEGAMARGWSGEGEHRELVQIAAQKINLADRVVLDRYEQLVSPTINPQLSQYFTDLTHLTQADVDERGVQFADMYEEFMQWSEGVAKYAYSASGEGLADAEVLAENIDLYGLSVPFPREEFANIGAVFASLGLDTKGYNSGRVHTILNIELAGHEHNAMHDVNSLVATLFALCREGD
jgi:inhibitor of KinA sporulation pathway (predicted exonuclease)